MTLTKEEIFLSEPIGDKTADSLPGIEESHARVLKKEGFEFAYQVFGQFLLFKQDEFLFVEWLKLFDIEDEAAIDCFNCLNTWAQKFM